MSAAQTETKQRKGKKCGHRWICRNPDACKAAGGRCVEVDPHKCRCILRPGHGNGIHKCRLNCTTGRQS